VGMGVAMLGELMGRVRVMGSGFGVGPGWVLVGWRIRICRD
jgi:hypothetical protein